MLYISIYAPRVFDVEVTKQYTYTSTWLDHLLVAKPKFI